MDALPRTSFLTYFRTPSQTQPKQRMGEEHQKRCVSNRGHCSQAPLLPRIPEDATAEHTAEESMFHDCEHFDTYESDEDNEQGWSWGDILSFTGYILLVMLIVLNMDFLMSAYNGNAGLLRWDGYRERADSFDREVSDCGIYGRPTLTYFADALLSLRAGSCSSVIACLAVPSSRLGLRLRDESLDHSYASEGRT